MGLKELELSVCEASRRRGCLLFWDKVEYNFYNVPVCNGDTVLDSFDCEELVLLLGYVHVPTSQLNEVLTIDYAFASPYRMTEFLTEFNRYNYFDKIRALSKEPTQITSVEELCYAAYVSDRLSLDNDLNPPEWVNKYVGKLTSLYTPSREKITRNKSNPDNLDDIGLKYGISIEKGALKRI